ncbi:MAG: type IV pilus assembly protein PilM [bacterium]|nr:type IV pilus assembly protein PilM [bacterium]
MFFFGSNRTLGVDIGTSSIKVAQLKKEAGKFSLETYGAVNVAFDTSSKGFDAIAETADILKKLLERTKVTTKKVVASLPNSIVFVSMIEIPEMSDKELKDSIQWEARRYVPLPLEEVTLSWSVYRDPESASHKLKVLLTAVPTAVVENYLKTFKLAGLRAMALEIEALALIRSLVDSSKDAFIIIDMGARNTSLNLVDKGFLRLSRNLSIGGENITTNIAQGLKVSLGRAEQFKKDLGLTDQLKDQIPHSIKGPIETVKNETAQLINIYESSGGKIQEIVFAGSGSRLPGLLNFFSDFGMKVSLGDPLRFINYDPRVKANLSRVSSSLSIAIGLAMRA